MTKAEYYYDFEFLEDGETIIPISIGIVCSDGREYYGVSSEAPWVQIRKHRFLRNHILPHLPFNKPEEFDRLNASGKEDFFKDRWQLDTENERVFPLWVIRNQVRNFIQNGLRDVVEGDKTTKEIASLWGYCSAYDHVALMQLWGPMVKRPSFLPTFTNDVRQECAELGVDDDALTIEYLTESGRMPKCKQPLTAHNALHDAYHVKAMREYLVDYRADRVLEEIMGKFEEGHSSAVRARTLGTILPEDAELCLQRMKELLELHRGSPEEEIVREIHSPVKVNVRQVISLLEGTHRNDFSNEPRDPTDAEWAAENPKDDSDNVACGDDCFVPSHGH